ncbi:M56 family metallopeptidase [Flavisolibacter sp. BT320]|nr:M56 family metallopeptidase [Flavisolibacter longurius]
MAALSQSHFLQALGWATLNSIWQMALLWAIFSGFNHLFKLSATRKYQWAVTAVLLGFTWFVSTFVLYYQNNSSSYAFFENTINQSNSVLNVCLISASITYLLLLVFPAIKLFRNWKFVKKIKEEGQLKAQLDYRLYVKKVSFLLGITKKVKVAVSTLVSSPVTVGYLKPVILLPVAAMNNLSPAQVEAILLHELSHIRRYDYLLNLVVSVLHTFLYFNPFVKSFMNVIETEREACCDELVLQFGYDKVSYASALLHLEKSSGRHQALAMAAAGKQNLLARIEKIVGMEKKKTFKLVQIVPLFLAMFCVLFFNSVLIIKDARSGEAMTYTSDVAVLTPWQLNNKPEQFDTRELSPAAKESALTAKATYEENKATDQVKIEVYDLVEEKELVAENAPVPVNNNIIPVNYDDVDGSLTSEEKQKVSTAVEATKKIAKTLQWNEIEASIGEVMSQQEKEMAKQEYLQELEKVSWTNIEQNLKVNFDKMDWDAIGANVAKAMSQVQLDSIQNVYHLALTELEKAEHNMKAAKAKCANTPMPDASVDQIQLAKEALKKNLDELKKAKNAKKIIKL